MKPYNIENAVISSTFLGIEDHGILTAMIGLDFGGASQSFGGFSFDQARNNEVIPSPAAAFFIRRILETVEVSKWENLKGKYVRVKRDSNGKLYALGNIIKDNWFHDTEMLGVN